ncbi:hypothetical protein ACOTD7_19250 [Achromobacter xylosoxidans]
MEQIYCIGGPNHGQPYNIVRRRAEGYAPIAAPLYSVYPIDGKGPYQGKTRIFAVIAGMDENEVERYAADFWEL